MVQEAFKLFVCEDGQWVMAKSYGNQGSAAGAAKLSMRAAGVAAVRVIHEYSEPEQKKLRRDLLVDEVKYGEEPPPPPPEASPLVPAPSARAVLPPANDKRRAKERKPAATAAGTSQSETANAPPRSASRAQTRRSRSRTERLAYASGAGAAAGIAGPLLLSSHLLSNVATGSEAVGHVYLTAMGLFIAVFAATMFLTAAPSVAAYAVVPDAVALSNAFYARIAPLDPISGPSAVAPSQAAAEPAADAEKPPPDSDAVVAGRLSLLKFLHATLSDGEAKTALTPGALDGINRLGFQLYVLGAGEACLAAIPGHQKSDVGEIAAATLAAIGSDAQQARTLAARIEELRHATRNAAMLRAGHAAMTLFLRENKPSGDALVAALKQWGAVREPTAEPVAAQDVVILFTDMVEPPIGDEPLDERKMMALVEQHDLITNVALKVHHGHIVKHTGEGIMAVFPSIAGGLAAARTIQRQIVEYNEATAGSLLAVRIGLANGNPIHRDDDYFGTVVQTAARLCAYAAPGEIALPDVMSTLPEAQSFAFGAPQAVALKGFAEAMPVRKMIW